MIDTNRTSLRGDGDNVSRVGFPMLSRATLTIEDTGGIAMIEGSQSMATSHHLHATILGRGLVEVDENREQRGIGMWVKHDVLMPAKFTRAMSD